MNQKEILVLSIGVFFTLVAWVVISIYQIQNKQYLDEEVKTSQVPQYTINEKIFPLLKGKNP
jgi:hypothetical protein